MNFLKQSKIYAAAKVKGDKEASGHAAAIILTIIAALGLLVLLSALVCNISCGGAEALAVIIGILGTAGIIWAAIAIIKRIKRGPKNKRPVKSA